MNDTTKTLRLIGKCIDSESELFSTPVGVNVLESRVNILYFCKLPQKDVKCVYRQEVRDYKICTYKFMVNNSGDWEN